LGAKIGKTAIIAGRGCTAYIDDCARPIFPVIGGFRHP
jgi:hypothetical protein